MSLAVIPLAITMNAGPQIMSEIIFVTTRKALRLSASFLAGGLIAVTAGVTITYTIASVLGNSVSLGDPSDSGSIGNIIQYVLVGLLVILSIRSYLGRKTSEPPRWLGAFEDAKPRTDFTAGLLVLLLVAGMILVFVLMINVAIG
jgi:Sap, sulfolipid-1-addressing protein